MTCKTFYALVRIETDKDVNAITTKIEKLETGKWYQCLNHDRCSGLA